MTEDSHEVTIVKLLKDASNKGTYMSGQKISDSLGLSRTAVWKHIENLRAEGYEIESSSKKGYRLKENDKKNDEKGFIFSDTEILSSLKTKYIGRELTFLAETESTNKDAFALARDGAREGSAVIAVTQKGGKGRLGRKWHSPEGRNIYTSIVLRPKMAPMEVQSITLMAAVAVADTIAHFIGEAPNVKWPNDILVKGRKISGILTEMKTDTDSVDFIILGIGMNVNMAADDFPEDIRKIASSIEIQKGKKVSLSEVTSSLYSSIEKWYEVFTSKGSEEVFKKWNEYFESSGKEVKVTAQNEQDSFSGLCLGIDERGALQVRDKDGNTRTVIAGDVERVRNA